MREDPTERSSRYLETMSEALKRLKTRKLPVAVSEKHVDKVLEMVHGYTRDAKHYVNAEKPVTSLACIAYAEGLLDALKFLELVDL